MLQFKNACSFPHLPLVHALLYPESYRHALYINIKTERGILLNRSICTHGWPIEELTLIFFTVYNVAGLLFILPGPWPCLPRLIAGHPLLLDVISCPLIFYSCSHWIFMEVQTNCGLCAFMGWHSLLSLQPVMEQQARPHWRICTISVLILIHRPGPSDRFSIETD